jgi:two-component system sensor histidine kinase PilS (NtrC family)
MFRRNSPAFLYDPVLAKRILKLIIGRFLFVTLIFFGGWWWGQAGSDAWFESIPKGSILFLPVIAILTSIYSLWLRFGRTLLWQIRAQFAVDAILVTSIIWQTGGLISPYITLYTILIGLAGAFLGKTDALAVAGSCVFFFTALPLITTPSFAYYFWGEGGPSRALQSIAFNDVAFLLVGLLAAHLADRRSIGDALKQAEASFANLNVLQERILESINSGLITTDLEGKIYAYNRASEEITGILPKSSLGRSIFDLFGDGIRPAIEPYTRRSATAGRSPKSFEVTLRQNALRGEVIVSGTVVPLLSAAGKMTGMIVAFQDATELRQMEEAVRRSDRLAAVGRLAAGLAHEIRNPLGSMSSALQFLAEKNGREDDDTELMDVILRESERLNIIITDFLAYARPEGTDSLNTADIKVDISNAIGDCLALLRHDPAVHDKHIFDFAAPHTKIVIKADETLVKQVIWNLVRNSIKSMPDGGKLSVRLTHAGPMLRITVSDEGRGIAPENIDKIFEPFHSGGGGTGLGLSIVHRIVTEHAGRIDVKSQLGRGTTFTIDLPK